MEWGGMWLKAQPWWPCSLTDLLAPTGPSIWW